jgi:hypothetical protein
LRPRGFPRHATYLALAFVGLALLLSRLFTPPELNVNLVFQRHGLLARPFPGLWSYRAAFALLIVGFLFLGEELLSRWLRPPRRMALERPAEEHPS